MIIIIIIIIIIMLSCVASHKTAASLSDHEGQEALRFASQVNSALHFHTSVRLHVTCLTTGGHTLRYVLVSLLFIRVVD